LAYASESEAVVDLALIIGAASVGLAAVMMVLILAIHGVQLLRERRDERTVRKWRLILIRCIDAVPKNLPRLRKPEITPFLNLWTHLQETLTGAARDNLNTVARAVGLDDTARRMLAKGSIRQQLMAITTLGHLHDRSVWYVLITVAQSPNSMLSLAAARAMIHIDPKGAMRLLTSLIASRTDWAPSRVIAILKEAHPDIITIPLAAAALRAPPSQAPRLIRYLSAIHSDYAMETIGLIIRTSEQQEVIAACLEMLKDPRDTALARAFVDHKNWNLRVLAASALGRIGTVEEEPVLRGMLHDNEWWVRYTAARALAELSPEGKEKLKQIEAEEQLPAAREILRLVIAELELV
jgi:HEAT repeat protein